MLEFEKLLRKRITKLGQYGDLLNDDVIHYPIPGMNESVPAFTTVTVCCDLVVLRYAEAQVQLERDVVQMADIRLTKRCVLPKFRYATAGNRVSIWRRPPRITG